MRSHMSTKQEHAVTQHTPGPWNLNGNSAWADSCKDRGNVFECRLRTGTHITHSTNQANAALIVRAVNAHAELVAALESMLARAEADFIAHFEECGAICTEEGEVYERELEHARAALCKARA